MNNTCLINGQKDGRAYIPPILQTMQIEPTDCQLVAKYDKKTCKTIFTFSVSWFADSKDEIEGQITTPSTNTNNNNKSHSFVSELTDSDATKIKKIAHSIASVNPNGTVENDSVTCDGPCGSKYSPSELRSLGRCGHYLCDLCFGIIHNTDGSVGCSAFSCAYQTLYNFLPENLARKAYEENIRSLQLERARRFGTEIPQMWDRTRSVSRVPSRRASSTARRSASRSSVVPVQEVARMNTVEAQASMPSSSSDLSVETRGMNAKSVYKFFSDSNVSMKNDAIPSSKYELLVFRLMIFERGVFNTIRRVHMSREVPASHTIREALTEILTNRSGYGEDHGCPARLYLCKGKNNGLEEISVEAAESTQLWKLPARKGVLHFALDYISFIKHNQ